MRLFISIPLSKKSVFSVKKIADSLSPDLKPVNGIKFVPSEKWHLTLVFLGEQKDISIPTISDAIKKSISSLKPPDIQLESIKYLPDKKPHMLWLATAETTSKYLESIKNRVENNLKDSGINWKQENHSYNGHITLARFNPSSAKILPKIEQDIAITFKARSVDLVASTLQKSGSKYETLFSMEYK